MEPVARHKLQPDASFDGGDLNCGNGLLLLIRQHIDPLERGQLLEIRSTDTSVDEDLPAWCRMTLNELVSWTREHNTRSFLVAKGGLAERKQRIDMAPRRPTASLTPKPVFIPTKLPAPAPVPPIPLLAMTGMGSWPRPRLLLRALHERLERCRKAEAVFGRERLLFHPDCGFATFADNPVATASTAEAKLAAIAEAVRRL